MKDDFRVWLSFFSNYNGTTVILDQLWSSNYELNLFSDSAGGKVKGFGICDDRKWAQACWSNSWISSVDFNGHHFSGIVPSGYHLKYLGESFRNRFVLLHIDNQAVMSIITKKSSRSPRVMSLVRKLVFACLKFNILIKTEHIPGNLNSLADSLSPCDFQEFRKLCPAAEDTPCAIPSHL